MERYKDLSGHSGVIAFEIRADAIIVQFKEGGRYLYDGRAPGLRHVHAMQRLAREGRGLATYINRHVREDFARQL
jgi:hypothetical protein